MTEPIKKKRQGRWKAGESGNPKGRPTGTGKVAQVRASMPEHYARAAIQDDLMQAWNTLFAEKTSLMRGISA